MSGSATVATTQGTTAPPPRGRCGLRRSGAWWQEAALVAVLDLLYEVTRSLAPERVAQAFTHARAIERVERILHLNPERFLNHALDRVPVLIPPMSVYYQIGHLVALLSVLIWAWARHPYGYPLVRNTLVGLTLGALAGYWLFPTAPPRFALSGVVDTVAAHPVLLARQESVVGLVNAYAAMPSLHVAWAVWVALAVSGLSAGRRRRLIWLHPAATTLAVLATANHYLLDVVAGVLLVGLAWLVGLVWPAGRPAGWDGVRRSPGRWTARRNGGPGGAARHQPRRVLTVSHVKCRGEPPAPGLIARGVVVRGLIARGVVVRGLIARGVVVRGSGLVRWMRVAPAPWGPIGGGTAA